jgi:hypothetical protein
LATANNLDAELCKQAFYDSTEATARLAAFCTARYSEVIGHGYYETRATELAIRDTILLCISLRRLAELTKTQKKLKAEELRSFIAKRDETGLYFEDSDYRYNLWEIIGNIVHAKNMIIINDDITFKQRFGHAEKDIEVLFRLIHQRKHVESVFLIESDRGDIKFFRGINLIKSVVDYLDKAEDTLSDNGIYVGHLNA